MQFTVNLTAGQRQRQQTAGRYLVILSTGAVPDVELWIMRGNEELEYIRTAAKGLQVRLGSVDFSHVEMRAADDTAVEIVISQGLVNIDTVEGATVNIANLPLPVATNRGQNIATPMIVAGITYDDVPASSMAEPDPVPVTAAPAEILPADPTRRAFRILNQGPDDVALGGPGLTWDKRVIVLGAGFGWEERDGAPLAWRAACEAGNTATITIQELSV